MRDDLLKGLTKEQIEKLNNCSSPEEIMALAEKEMIPLTDEQLDAVTGGCGGPKESCPACGSDKTFFTVGTINGKPGVYKFYRCRSCGYDWDVKM